jgi:nucleoside-diphosphate-sugar epimerase
LPETNWTHGVEVEATSPLILLTGAAGFLGRVVGRELVRTGFRVRAIARAPSSSVPFPASWMFGDLKDISFCRSALSGTTDVIHCAARAHVTNAVGDSDHYSVDNVVAVSNLTEMSAANGAVRMFLLASSVKVGGESTVSPLTESAPAHPIDAYGRSKLAAEQLVLALGPKIRPIICRFPLIYGPGVRANFLEMLHWIKSGKPFPVGIPENRRSLLYSENAASAVIFLMQHPFASGVFYVRDRSDISTADLARAIAEGFGTSARLVRLPRVMLSTLARLGDVLPSAWSFPLTTTRVQRLVDNLQVDDGRLRALGFFPPFDFADGIRATTAAIAHGETIAS